jgi:hypothetical protein
MPGAREIFTCTEIFTSTKYKQKYIQLRAYYWTSNLYFFIATHQIATMVGPSNKDGDKKKKITTNIKIEC